MVFSSMTFVPLFLPLVLVLYYLTKHPAVRNTVLLVFSVLFYAWGEPKWIFVMLLTVTVNYLCGTGGPWRYVECDNGETENCLVVTDSFGLTVIPFLTQNYK